MTARSFLQRLLLLLAAVALFATSCGDSSSEVETTAPSQASGSESTQAEVEPAPEPALVASTVTGSQIDFGSLEGQDVVLWFWAPW